LAVWLFAEGDDVPADVIRIEGGSAKWLCDVIVCDGDDGRRHIIARKEPYIYVEGSGEVYVGRGQKLFLHSPKFFHLV
jgi:hypothetical protein